MVGEFIKYHRRQREINRKRNDARRKENRDERKRARMAREKLREERQRSFNRRAEARVKGQHVKKGITSFVNSLGKTAVGLANSKAGDNVTRNPVTSVANSKAADSLSDVFNNIAKNRRAMIMARSK